MFTDFSVYMQNRQIIAIKYKEILSSAGSSNMAGDFNGVVAHLPQDLPPPLMRSIHQINMRNLPFHVKLYRYLIAYESIYSGLKFGRIKLFIDLFMVN